MARRVLVTILLFFCMLIAACKKENSSTVYDYRSLGAAAHDLLSSGTYTSLMIQIGYMPSYEPDTASINKLVTFLNSYISKPAGIHINKYKLKSSGKSILTTDDLVIIERQHRSAFTDENIISVHILITDSKYSDSTIFALSYWNTSICLFGKNISENSDGPGQVSKINLVSTLFQHEFGHLLGLVGQGTPMQVNHRDADHGAHCINPDCLMYYGVETNGNIGAPGSGSIPLPDINCINDLKANRNR